MTVSSANKVNIAFNPSIFAIKSFIAMTVQTKQSIVSKTYVAGLVCVPYLFFSNISSGGVEAKRSEFPFLKFVAITVFISITVTLLSILLMYKLTVDLKRRNNMKSGYKMRPIVYCKYTPSDSVDYIGTYYGSSS